MASAPPLLDAENTLDSAAEAPSPQHTNLPSSISNDESIDQAQTTVDQAAYHSAVSSGNNLLSTSALSLVPAHPYPAMASNALPWDLPHSLASMISEFQPGMVLVPEPPPKVGTFTMKFMPGSTVWGTTLLPFELDEQFQSMTYSKAQVLFVEPYVDMPWTKQKGGSGILDTDTATHMYLRPYPGTTEYSAEESGDLEDDREHFLADDISYLSVSGSEDDGDRGQGDWVVEEVDCSTAEIPPSRSLAEMIFGKQTSPGNTEGTLTSSYPAVHSLGPSTAQATSVPLASAGHPPLLQISHSDIPSLYPGLLEAAQNENNEDGFFEKIQGMLPFSNCSSSSMALLFNSRKYPKSVDLAEADPSCRRVLILLEDGGVARISMLGSLVGCFPGQGIKVIPWSFENLSTFCWEIMFSHHIRRVISFEDANDVNTRSGLPKFDRQWIYRLAKPAMHKFFPKVAHYLLIQSLCRSSVWAAEEHDIIIFYFSLDHLPFHYLFAEPVGPCEPTLEETMANGNHLLVDDTRNMTVSQFIKRTYMERKLIEPRRFRPSEAVWLHKTNDDAAMVDEWEIAEHVMVPEDFNHFRETFDLQQIDWENRVGLPADVVRDLRDEWWIDAKSIGGSSPGPTPQLQEKLNAANFVPQAMHTAYKASGPHFQLRNLMAVKNHVSLIYASDRGSDHSKVFQLMPWSSDQQARKCIIDLSQTSNETIYRDPVKITCVALSSEPARDLCMVGGFGGEYAMRALNSREAVTVVGLASCASNGIINHIDLDFTTLSGAHHAVMACNDNKIRVLDCETNTFLHNPNPDNYSTSGESSGHRYPWPVNCTATSPDGRLRVIVGDTPDVTIVNAETGYCERLLQGHFDYGFACAWAPDGLTVATANQDRLVNIYDTRTWRILSSFESEGPGPYTSMKFSPVGGGTRCLLLAEAADRVTVVNAHNYTESQTHSFYGEISGIDFLSDGSSFWVANSDEKFGGMMEFQRRGLGQPFGLHFQRRREIEDSGDEYREEGPNEWIYDDERYEDERCADPGRGGPMSRRQLFGTNFILPGLRDM